MTLVQWITLLFFPRLSGVAVFILVTPANSTIAVANKERGEREGERGRDNPPDSHPEGGIELSAKHLHGYRPYLSVRVQRERETEEEQTTSPDNYLFSVALTVSWLVCYIHFFAVSLQKVIRNTL